MTNQDQNIHLWINTVRREAQSRGDEKQVKQCDAALASIAAGADPLKAMNSIQLA